MKTNRLILKNGLLTLLVIVSLSLNCFASVEENENVASFAVIKRHKTKDLTIPATASKENVFTETLKNWMENGLYWESVNATESENSEIPDEMLQAISADKSSTLSEVGTELFNSLRTWMQNGFYWDKQAMDSRN